MGWVARGGHTAAAMELLDAAYDNVEPIVIGGAACAVATVFVKSGDNAEPLRELRRAENYLKAHDSLDDLRSSIADFRITVEASIHEVDRTTPSG